MDGEREREKASQFSFFCYSLCDQLNSVNMSKISSKEGGVCLPSQRACWPDSCAGASSKQLIPQTASASWRIRQSLQAFGAQSEGHIHVSTHTRIAHRNKGLFVLSWHCFFEGVVVEGWQGARTKGMIFVLFPAVGKMSLKMPTKELRQRMNVNADGNEKEIKSQCRKYGLLCATMCAIHRVGNCFFWLCDLWYERRSFLFALWFLIELWMHPAFRQRIKDSKTWLK